VLLKGQEKEEDKRNRIRRLTETSKLEYLQLPIPLSPNYARVASMGKPRKRSHSTLLMAKMVGF